MRIGVLHPGTMGASIAAAAASVENAVFWVSDGRSSETAARALAAGAEPVGDLDSLCGQVEMIISVCPPHAADPVSRAVRAGGFDGVYVDANAVSPQTAALIGERHANHVDGGIIGPPVRESGSTRMYVSSADADLVANVIEVFSGSELDVREVAGGACSASALKMAYAGWTKGSAALQLSVQAFARAEGVEDTLLSEWELSQPEVHERAGRLASSVASKAWRWIAEMEEISASLGHDGLPEGFHLAAAEIYRSLAEFKDGPPRSDVVIDRILEG